MENILSTCFEASTVLTRTIASYSHIIPMTLALFLSIFVYIKSKKVFLSKILLFFTITFSLWLLGDLTIWTSNRFNLIYALWAPLDYLEIVFYVFGLYFATVFVKKSDISIFLKATLFAATLPAFLLTVSGKSVTGFNSYVCEASNSDFLGSYKLVLEGFILTVILMYMIVPFVKKLSWKEKKADLVVLGSMFLFLSVFAITEYLASVTGHYELNLYSLFLLPVFLIAIIYSVFELDIFNVHILGTHYLVVGLVVLAAGQLLFISNTANRLLTILTLFFTIGLSTILFGNLKKESDQRIQIEKLNTELGLLLQQRESLVHLVTHKVKGAFTRSKFIFSGLLDGTYGDINEKVGKVAHQGLEFSDDGIETVDSVLNAANLKKGTIKYEKKPVDIKEIVSSIISQKKGPAEKKGLALETDIKEGNYQLLGDKFWLKEAIYDLVDNAVKYTPAGKIIVGLERQDDKVHFFVKDTGGGITDEDKKVLFTEGGRGKESTKVNVDSTGYGLFTIKLIVDAHMGRVWVESEVGKGSTFFVELPVAQA